jgi:hypothetical protein
LFSVQAYTTAILPFGFWTQLDLEGVAHRLDLITISI